MRAVVIGTSGAGKTTYARALAAAAGVVHVELDALHWGENWTPRRPDDFAARVTVAAAGSGWIADGNYSAVRDLLWSRATDIIWLNYNLQCVMARVLKRTIVRVITRQELWAGNRETFGMSFLSRDSVLWWSLTTFRANRLKYNALRESGQFPHLKWHEFHHPRQAAHFLDNSALAQNTQDTI